MRWISLTDVNISESEVFGLERGDVALAGALHQPIIVAGQRGGTKVMAIGLPVAGMPINSPRCVPRTPSKYSKPCPLLLAQHVFTHRTDQPLPGGKHSSPL